MKTMVSIEPLDLYSEVPRSSRESFAGVVHLPRMTDKARAFKNETLGEYIYPCPLDRLVLKYLKIDAESFASLAKDNDDKIIERFAEDLNGMRTQVDREKLKEQVLDRKPSLEDMHWFVKQRDHIESGRTDVVTYVDLNDLEEGHI